MKPVSRVVALLGPTASGKTALALQWAKQAPVEIINMDSALIYKGMDIGTAKPSAQERAQVPHHLIDILDPAQAYSAAQFVGDVMRLIPQIHARGATPLLVGGTMMYFRALIHGLADLPPSHPPLRAALQAEVDACGIEVLHNKLAQVDPISAQRLNPRDTQRVMRAYEVYLLSGRTLSSWHQQQTLRSFPWPVEKIALIPAQRAWLHARIAQRLAQMQASGFLQEVQTLFARGDLSAEMPALRAVGYRQLWQSVEGVISLDQAWEQALYATRQLAKRQLTWLRSEPDSKILQPDRKEDFSPFV